MTLHIQFISKQMVRLDITEMKNVGSCVEVSSSLVKHIHAQQFKDLRFKVIQKKFIVAILGWQPYIMNRNLTI